MLTRGFGLEDLESVVWGLRLGFGFQGLNPDDSDRRRDLDNMVQVSVVEAAIISAEAVVYHTQSSREKIFCELYVDRGSLSNKMATIHATTASTFGLPEWDVQDPSTQQAFKKLLRDVVPSHVWMVSEVWER